MDWADKEAEKLVTLDETGYVIVIDGVETAERRSLEGAANEQDRLRLVLANAFRHARAAGLREGGKIAEDEAIKAFADADAVYGDGQDRDRVRRAAGAMASWIAVALERRAGESEAGIILCDWALLAPMSVEIRQRGNSCE